MKRHLLFKSLVLLCALVVGSNAWATDVTYTISSKNTLTTTGTAPTGSAASIVETYTTSTQMTGGNSQTLTLSGYNGYNITNITLSMHSNSKSGSGKLSYSTDGGKTFTYLIGSSSAGVQFNASAWYNAWSTNFVNISKNVDIKCSLSNLIIKIEATANSLFCESYKLTYSSFDATTDPTITFNNGSVNVGQTLNLSTLFTSNSDAPAVYSITNGGDKASLDGTTLTGVAVGSVTVQASQARSGIYRAATQTATITVNAAKELSSIAVTTPPTKTAYEPGELFDPTGMVVTATYSDASTDDVTASCTYSPNVALTLSDDEITISYTEGGTNKTTTQAITVTDCVELPFAWAGGSSSALTAIIGVSASGLGSDYAAGNSPYLVKFDSNNDYILIKTDGQPGKVSIGVKMLGGSGTSKIKIQESANGTDFDDVQEFTVSGAQNDVVNLVTTDNFATTSRYVRIIKSVHPSSGGNLGVGPISIALPGEPALPLVSGTTITLTTTLNMAGWRTYDNNTDKKYTVDGNTKVYYASATGSSKVTLTEIEGGVPANTTVILHQTSGTEITLTETSNTITAPASNLLQVSTAGQNLGKVYRLGYKSSDGVGFYTYTTASAPAGIIYISSVSSARDFLGFDFDETTAIESVKTQKADGQYYNLAGQRVAQPTKGLYIVNGKKVLRP